ncbi:hypothetical protein [Streptomyces chattanoogensis]|uniref:hypothetical protein n=1 Tax=Streptomyces chattanoogensis TaxID=66876 RepID=UPI0036B0600C
MATDNNADQSATEEAEDSLEGAFTGAGASDKGAVFGAWGASAPAGVALTPGPAGAGAAAGEASNDLARLVANLPTQQSITPDDREPYKKPIGFRVSSNVAKRLEKYRKDKDLTVTEVVMLMVDRSVSVMEEMVEYAVQGPKVKTSLFAPQGVAGPPKGTGPEQRQWKPRPQDLQVMEDVVKMSGLSSINVYIAVALNYCLPEKPCKKD